MRAHRGRETYLEYGEPNIADNDSAAAYTAHASKLNVTCFKCSKKGHYVKDCLEKESAHLTEEEPDGVW